MLGAGCTWISAKVLEIKLEGKVIAVFGRDNPGAVLALENTVGTVADEFCPALPADRQDQLGILVFEGSDVV